MTLNKSSNTISKTPLGETGCLTFFFNFFLQYIRMVKPTKYKQRQTVKNNGTKD